MEIISQTISLISRTTIYGLMFTLSLLFINRADKNAEKSKLKFWVFSIIGLFIPCLFAALRAETVGTDVLHYAKPYFQLAQNTSSLVTYLALGSAEIGYEVFCFAVSKMFGNFQVFLFCTELLVILPVYMVAAKNRKKCSMWLVMLSYFCIFYGASFNFMRQSIAAAFLLLSYFYFVDNKKIRGFILVGLAQSFHNTAIIGFAMIILGMFYFRIKRKVLRQLIFILFCGVMVLLVGQWDTIIWTAINYGIFPARFSTYIDLFSSGANSNSYYFILTGSNYIEFLFRIICYCLPFYIIKIRSKYNELYESINLIVLMTVAIYSSLFILFHTSYAVRVTWYTEFFFLAWIPMAYNTDYIKKSVLSCSLSNFLIVSFLLIYWFVGFMILGWHGTLPFSFL